MGVANSVANETAARQWFELLTTMPMAGAFAVMRLKLFDSRGIGSTKKRPDAVGKAVE